MKVIFSQGFRGLWMGLAFAPLALHIVPAHAGEWQVKRQLEGAGLQARWHYKTRANSYEPAKLYKWNGSLTGYGAAYWKDGGHAPVMLGATTNDPWAQPIVFASARHRVWLSSSTVITWVPNSNNPTEPAPQWVVVVETLRADGNTSLRLDSSTSIPNPSQTAPSLAKINGEQGAQTPDGATAQRSFVSVRKVTPAATPTPPPAPAPTPTPGPSQAKLPTRSWYADLSAVGDGLHESQMGITHTHQVTASSLGFDLSVEAGESGTNGSVGLITGERNQYKFYAIVRAKVTLPANCSGIPNQLTFLMRGKDASGAAVEETCAGYRVTTQGSSDGPQLKTNDDGSLSKTWTFRSRIAQDWDITQKVGRWKISVKEDPQTMRNPISLKIDKRAQIVKYASHWADIWPTLGYPYGTTGYPQPQDVSPANPLVFSACSGFTDHIYGHLGLEGLGLNGENGVLDQGDGSLFFFRDQEGAIDGPFAHTGVHVGNLRMVDVNHGLDSTGPKERNCHFGTGYSSLAEYWGEPGIDMRSIKDPTSGSSKSLLQALDDESGNFTADPE